jgi:hypothetical protein
VSAPDAVSLSWRRGNPAVTLADTVLTAVDANPGVTTNLLCKQVKVRKSDVLAESERLLQVDLLRVVEGSRASKCWYAVAGRGN